MATKKVVNENAIIDNVTVEDTKEKDTRIRDLEAQIRELNKVVAEQEQRIQYFQSSFECASTERDEANRRVDELTRDKEDGDLTISQLKILVGNLQKENEQIKDLANRVTTYRSALIQLAKEIG